METLIVVLTVVLGVPLVLFLWVTWGAIRIRPPARMVECAVCGRQLPAKNAVIVHGQITRDRDAYATTVAEYCKAHAPGPPRSLP